MKAFAFVTLFISTYFVYITCPPVKEAKPNANNETASTVDQLINLEYERYLKEIVQVLESDPDFRKKLETANPDDIRSGQIATGLEMVNHKVRTQLDEIKRQELRRLKELHHREMELQNGVYEDINDPIGIDHRRPGKIPQHLDHNNPHTFEIEDLKRLIVQTTNDLEEADRQRRDDFKEYEMHKEHDRLQKMKEMDEEHRKKAQEQYEMDRKKHMDHPKMHHPGSKQQLEEVWEEQDHMRPEDFEPRTFFAMHDLDGDGFWDPEEVNALFQKELNKVYNSDAKEDDMRERIEEMERMREHIFNETDRNKDKLISMDEFLQQSKQPDFEQDPGWEGLEDQKFFTSEEFEAYERRQEEMRRAQGIHPPPHIMPPPGQGGPYHPNQVPYQVPPHQQGQQYQYQGVPPNQQYQGNPNQQYQGHPNQQYQGQGAHPNQPYQGAQPNQPYQGGNPNQQYQGQPNQVPQVPSQQYQNNQQSNQYQHQPQQQQVPQQQVPQQNQNQQPAGSNQNNNANQQQFVQDNSINSVPQKQQQVPLPDSKQAPVPASQNTANSNNQNAPETNSIRR